ncbi:MAG TPA: TIR domain-containing protein [Candidatus Angelobacter sp.]
MPESFQYDVFLSHSSKDKPVVRPLAERLRKDGLRVWFDEWVLKPGDNLPKKIDDGLEESRVLLLCMSANAFGSDWAALESGTFRFRDPLNKDRRFIPLRLDETPIKGSLSQFLYVNWLPKDRKQEYAKLFEACRPSVVTEETVEISKDLIQLNSKAPILAYAFSGDGRVITAGKDAINGLHLWDLKTKKRLRTFEGHQEIVSNVEWRVDQGRAISAGYDGTVRLWDVQTGRCLRVLKGHTGAVRGVALSPDNRLAISSSNDKTLRVWDIETGACLRLLEGHTDIVIRVTWSADQKRALSSSEDKTLRLWDMESGRCLRTFEGHTSPVWRAALSTDNRSAISGGRDGTVRLWNVETGKCLRILEGHKGGIVSLDWNLDGRLVVSGGFDNTVRLWDMKTGRCIYHLQNRKTKIGVRCVEWKLDPKRIFIGDSGGGIRVWDVSKLVVESSTAEATIPSSPSDQVQYTNAKVLLVGESGAGKTGLSKVLAGENWQPSDSTVGAWATQWKLPVSSNDGVEREVWLWDFGGQADQRLIHQLYMEDTALAILVFDGQKEDLFETLGQWDRDLTRASRKPFSKVLAAGRVDAGGLRISRGQIDTFRKERGFATFVETSAKANLGCQELKEAILKGIRWADIPWRSSPLLFKRLKQEILSLKDAGRVLMRFNELREAIQLRLLSLHEGESGEGARFSDSELKAVVGLLAGPGVVWELSFGSWVLLQPERINAYAQAVIQTMREDKYERGCLPEERVLNGDLIYHSSIKRLEADDERFVLLAMHQILVERGLCLREHTENGPLLIFPSYYRRERPELVGHPAVLVSYRFNGFLDDIYATLVVRLHHTKPFQQDALWRYAADFKTLTGKQLGVKLARRAEGAGELEVYFDPSIPMEEKIIFSRYVHEHLLQSARDVVRLRHYVCPYCGTPIGNREIAMKKLQDGKKDIPCENCDDPAKRIPLWDKMEELFGSAEVRVRVAELQNESSIVLDNESKERALVGEVISTVALSGQICREFNVSDHGIDMEIEFKSDVGEATGKKLYLQLKSGDSYLRERKKDGAEIFNIKDERHTRYWMDQAFPVMLVVRNSEGEVRWMEVRDWLKHASNKSSKPVKQIVFQGDRFDVMSVRRWREKLLD